MTFFTFSTQALTTLLALATLTTGAMACAPLPDAEEATPSPGGAVVVDPSTDEQPSHWIDTDAEDVLTPAVRNRVLQNIAFDLGRPVETLRIAAAETAIFDGCMGIYVPDLACTEIALFGLRVVVTDGDQSWVYHTHQEADTHGVVQNPTASGSRNGLIPDFIPRPVTEGEAEPEDHLFRSVESGSLAGYFKETILTTDGRLIQRESGRVVAEARLAPDQVAAFQQVLEDQRFPNLHRMRYVTDAAFADYPTVRLSSWSMEVDYIDLALADAPVALQAIVSAWDAVTAEAGLESN
ncbi:hypothetical protein GFS31_42560 (plasmid) [Leptolyngbya sp. BL0902]|uniref:hypothetical protein n=1 Tax=Leptolyngbya sp. BL0902 TaxID=1115757 RepID=UPI0018E70F7C|nr:hypothetical protein [Leptolyngbya sp. BL0902]QQE67543.1 hypothetical protein GFS31_42560 [Leptolyngbya sp. BL0902]